MSKDSKPGTVISRAIEALENALAWEGRLNKAEQLGMQGHKGIRECLTIKAAVLREQNAAHASLAELRGLEVVEG